MEDVKSYLARKFIKVSDEWIEQCVDFILEEYGQSLNAQEVGEHVYQQWLFADLSELNFPGLPSCVHRANRFVLNGNFSVQMNAVFDASVSAYSQYQKLTGTENANAKVTADEEQHKPPWEKDGKRMLVFELTDGVTAFRAMEYQSIPSLKLSDLTPGCKMLIHGRVTCRKGMALLTAENVKILGGNVESLINAYNAKVLLSQRIEDAKSYRFNAGDDTTLSRRRDTVISSRSVNENTPPANQRRPAPQSDCDRQKYTNSDSASTSVLTSSSRRSANDKQCTSTSYSSRNSSRNTPSASTSKNDSMAKTNCSSAMPVDVARPTEYCTIKDDDIDEEEADSVNKVAASFSRSTFSENRSSVQPAHVQSSRTIAEPKIDTFSQSNHDLNRTTGFAFHTEIIENTSDSVHIRNGDDSIQIFDDDLDFDEFPAAGELNDDSIPPAQIRIGNISLPPTPPLGTILMTSNKCYSRELELHHDPSNGISLKSRKNNSTKRNSLEHLMQIPDNLNICRLSSVLRSSQIIGQTPIQTSKYLTKGTVIQIVQRLNVVNEHWFCVVKISDGTCCLDCELSNEVLTQLLGMTAAEALAIKNSALESPKMRAAENIKVATEFLKNFDGLIELDYAHRTSLPVVRTFRKLNSDDVKQLTHVYYSNIKHVQLY